MPEKSKAPPRCTQKKKDNFSKRDDRMRVRSKNSVSSSMHTENSTIVKGRFCGFFSFYIGYSTLLHLPPLRFHCVGRCWDRTQDCSSLASTARRSNQLQYSNIEKSIESSTLYFEKNSFSSLKVLLVATRYCVYS
jgi:hypothetical protein